MTDIVARAGASVGSLYHHFSGKADLYLALFDELQSARPSGPAPRCAGRRDAGVTDPMGLFLAGARAYLDGCIDQRELAAAVLRGRRAAGVRAGLAAAAAGLGEQEHRVLRPQRRAAGRGGGHRDDRRHDAGGVGVARAAADSARAQLIADGVISVLSRLEIRRRPGCCVAGACWARRCEACGPARARRCGAGSRARTGCPGWPLSLRWAIAAASLALAPSSHSSQMAARRSPRSHSSSDCSRVRPPASSRLTSSVSWSRACS